MTEYTVKVVESRGKESGKKLKKREEKKKKKGEKRKREPILHFFFFFNSIKSASIQVQNTLK